MLKDISEGSTRTRIAASDAVILDHVLLRTSGRPTGYTYRILYLFMHIENDISPMRRRKVDNKATA